MYFEYVVSISLGVLAFTHLWDWVGDRLFEWSLPNEVVKKEDENE